VAGKPKLKLCLPACAKIVEQPGPGLEPNSIENPLELRSKVLFVAMIPRDYALFPRLSFLEAIQQIRGQFREDRHDAIPTVSMTLRLVCLVMYAAYQDVTSVLMSDSGARRNVRRRSEPVGWQRLFTDEIER
jgi:hypothetical protein